MVEVSLQTVVNILSVISMACFAWAWRLQTQITKLNTVQEIKVTRLDTIEEKLDKLCDDVSNIKGVLSQHLK